MGESHWERWLRTVTRETSMRGVARKIGVSHTTVQNWVRNGVPTEKVAEITHRFGADPIEALVLTGLVREEHVPHLNYEEIVKYVPVEVLAGELSRRATLYSQTRPDPMRKVRTSISAGPHPADANARHSFRLTTK